VATLLALGMLAVLATNGVVYGQTSKGNIVYEQTSKASFAACMWLNDWRFDDSKIVYRCAHTALGLGFGSGDFIAFIIYIEGGGKSRSYGGSCGFRCRYGIICLKQRLK
jgi:hypothetical protein